MMKGKFISLLLLCLLLTIFSCKNEKSNDDKKQSICKDCGLKFDVEGKFKIAQFTDIHWDEKADNCNETADIIRHVLREESPDLAVLTGDIVCYDPAEEGWASISKIFSEANTPWTVVMGNHDAEQSMTREEIYGFLDKQPYYIGETGLAEIHGVGNFVLPVKDSIGDRIAAAIYCLDSNDYPSNTLKYGHTDWIRFDQIVWYRNISEQLAKENGENPLPALAYFHIPVPEHSEIRRGEKPIYASSRINSGFFCSAIEMKDIMGMFVGHIHSLSHVGIKSDIALGYGRVSGLNAEGRLERGARIVLLYEDQFAFDTWIRTKSGQSDLFYYPSGIFAEEEEIGTYLEATETNAVEQGVAYVYYEYEKEEDVQSVEHLVNSKNSTVVKTGKMKNFSLDPAEKEDYFGFEFNTWIKIPEDGLYKFYSYTDDGSRLYIDDQLVVDNDGSHNTQFREGKVCLKAGYHHMKVLYFESYMGQSIEIGITSRKIPQMIIPDEMLFIKSK